MSDFKAVFNLHDLSELFVISPPERTLTAWEPTSVEAVIGATPTGTKAQPMEIKLTLTTFAETERQRLADLRTLSSWLAVDEPKSLVLTDELYGEYSSGNRAYMMRYAWPSGAPKVTPALNATTVEVTFICPDPRAYETVYTYVPSTETWTVSEQKQEIGHIWSSPEQQYVGKIFGTAPTKPRVHLHGVHGDETGKFYLSIYPSSGSGSRCNVIFDAAEDASLEVDVDSETRTLRIGPEGGTLTPVYDLQMDWSDLTPDVTYTSTLMRGWFTSGALNYYPRWW